VDINDVYDNQDREALRIAEVDKHPNAKAHKLIADRLYEALRENGNIIP
jgi:hypothetical protein